MITYPVYVVNTVSLPVLSDDTTIRARGAIIAPCALVQESKRLDDKRHRVEHCGLSCRRELLAHYERRIRSRRD